MTNRPPLARLNHFASDLEILESHLISGLVLEGGRVERRLGLWRPVSAGLAQTPVNPDIRLNFPVNSISIPVIREFFPVNFLREFDEKPLRHSRFSTGNGLQKPRNRKIPC